MQSRVRILAPAILRSIISERPPEELTTGLNLPATLSITSSGMGELILPDDFFRLVALKMSDWDYCVKEITSSADPKFPLQSSQWCGIKGSRNRPIVVLDYNSDGKRVLKLFSSGSGSALSIGLYLPKPCITSSDTIMLPRDLYSLLVKKIAGSL